MHKISVLATALLALSACSSFKEPCYYELGLTANRPGNTHDLMCAWGKKFGAGPSWQEQNAAAFRALDVQREQQRAQDAIWQKEREQRGREETAALLKSMREHPLSVPSPTPLTARPSPALTPQPAPPDASSALKRIDRFGGD